MSTSRRSFLKAAGIGAVAVGADPAAAAAAKPAGDAPQPKYVFFNEAEAAFIEAAVARLIPADDAGPGAIEAEVPRYIDRQLAGAWGAGERLYRSGPWHPGEPEQGYQLPFTPAELFRNALRGLREEADKGGQAFEAMELAQQDEFLKNLQTEPRDLAGVPSNVFFESLWGMTVEGFFCDPVYGGNKDMVSWSMIGFPGAYAAYYHYVDRHGERFELPPISLAGNAHGVIHLHPDIDAAKGNAAGSAGGRAGEHAGAGGH